MMGAEQRYRELLVELAFQRVAANDQLSQEVEAEFAAELDICWQLMTDEEQARMEQQFADGTLPDAPIALRTEDCLVTEGSWSAPRKAA
ncbi:MAG: hypothetical protein JNM40_19485 [Myxococcales bacterium]|nr:hypothetical protein [Myxococcales bacterium]